MFPSTRLRRGKASVRLFGLVLLEAFATSTLVLATSVGGVPEVVNDGVTGRLCAPNMASMTTAMEQMMTDSRSSDTMAKNALDEVQADGRFHWSRGVAEYEAFFEGVLRDYHAHNVRGPRNK